MQERARKALGGLGRWAATLTRPGRRRTTGGIAWAALLAVWLATVPALAAESPPEWHWWRLLTVTPAAAQGSPAQWSYSFEPSGQAQATYPGDATIAGTLTAAAIAPGSLTTLFASPPPIGSTAPGTGAFTSLAASGAVTGAGFAGLLAAPGPIGSTTPGTGAFSSLAASGAVTGAGFAGLLAAPGPIGSTTPGTGAFTTLAATSTITPSQTSGVVGTTTNNNANAGSDGEFISSNVPVGSQVALTTGTAANITSVSLTAGDWDCRGNIVFNPAGTTTITAIEAVLNTTSATLPTSPGGGAESLENITFTTGGVQILQTGTLRVSIASTSSVFLIASTAFATSTMNGFGFIGCRRVR
jgi:hypothetical protein